MKLSMLNRPISKCPVSNSQPYHHEAIRFLWSLGLGAASPAAHDFSRFLHFVVAGHEIAGRHQLHVWVAWKLLGQALSAGDNSWMDDRIIGWLHDWMMMIITIINTIIITTILLSAAIAWIFGCVCMLLYNLDFTFDTTPTHPGACCKVRHLDVAESLLWDGDLIHW